MNATQKAQLTRAVQTDEARIEALRRQLKPSAVRLHHVPDFFRRRLLKAYGCSYGDNSGYGALGHAERKHGWHWVDHPGSTTYRGRPAFVSEPYQLSFEDHAAIDALCRECNLAYFVSANSWWNPGSTLRVLIYEPEGEA